MKKKPQNIFINRKNLKKKTREDKKREKKPDAYSESMTQGKV